MLDVLIIGGGICGCSLLYELSRYQLQVALVEKENDVGVGSTKANSAISHAGYDPEPGTLMARYNVEGNHLIEQLCADLDVPHRKCGSLVIGFTENDRKTIEKLHLRGQKNGVPNLRVAEYEELHKMEPTLSEEAKFALYAPSGAVINPWELASAQAEMAVLSGAKVYLDSKVTAIEKENGHFLVYTAAGCMKTRYLVNAAGTHADKISAMLGENDFTILPARGEYFLLDTTQGHLAQHVIFQCPTAAGKGVLVAPTVHGNLIVGPNTENCDFDDVNTTDAGLDYVRSLALRSVPGINFRESIRIFAGIRAVSDHSDFIVGESPKISGYFRMAGIKSPGLTSAPAIAKDIVAMLGKSGLALHANPDFQGKRHVLRFKNLDSTERDAAIKSNPLYGTIVCRCETVTEGEIVDAMHRPLPPRSIDAVKRRCTPGMGRCQGGFCSPRVQAIIARELHIRQQDVPQDRAGMHIVIGETKMAEGEQA